jgi:ribosome-associated protein
MSEAREMVKKIHSALEDKKADDITVIDITEVSCLADYFIITNGENNNQVQAMADSVDEAMTKAGHNARGIEGYSTANWILLDYGDVVVHIFSKDDRRFYDLERIWRDGKAIDVSELN